MGTRTVRRRSTGQLLTLFGLGEYWAGELERQLTAEGAGSPDAWDMDAVRTWKARTLATIAHVEPHHLRALALRSHPVPATVIASRLRRTVTGPLLDQWGLALALAYTHDLAPLRPGRAGDRLRRSGFPPMTSLPRPVQARALEMWLAGVPRAHVREQAQLTVAAMRRFEATAPRRLSSGDVSDLLGWSADNIFQRLSRGTFPEPDGVDGGFRWWWQDTVTSWAQRVELVSCPVCGAQVERLGQHMTAHTNTRAALDAVSERAS